MNEYPRVQFWPTTSQGRCQPVSCYTASALRRQAKKGFPSHSHEYFQKMGKQHRASGARRRAIKRAWGARCFVDREEEVGMKRYL